MQTPPPINSSENPKQLRASKWNCLQALFGEEEWSALFEALGSPSLFFCGSMWPKESFQEHQTLFAAHLRSYTEALKQGALPDLSQARTYFSACLTDNVNTVYLQDVQNDQYLLRFSLPIIQVQHHTMNYSPYDGKMHSMVFGRDAITWGVQFSYPQMYLDMDGQVRQTSEGSSHPNKELFKTLQRWIRHNTLPCTFLCEERKIPSSIRIGKALSASIMEHPQLRRHGLQLAP